MKLYVLGASRRYGKGKSSGENYDMAFINTITGLRSSSRPDNTFQAAGFRQMEVQLDPTCINEFLGLNYPAEYEVLTDSRPSQNGLVTVITGLKK